MKKTQVDAVVEFMVQSGGFATLSQLYSNVTKIKNVNWDTKTPDASIRRIVQDKKRFLKIKPGLYALLDYKSKLPLHVKDLITDSDDVKKSSSLHYYYQGILVEMGNLKGFTTYIPPQDKNRNYINSTLGEISTIKTLPKFTYERMILRQDSRHRFSTALSLGGFHKKV